MFFQLPSYIYIYIYIWTQLIFIFKKVSIFKQKIGPRSCNFVYDFMGRKKISWLFGFVSLVVGCCIWLHLFFPFLLHQTYWCLLCLWKLQKWWKEGRKEGKRRIYLLTQTLFLRLIRLFCSEEMSSWIINKQSHLPNNICHFRWVISVIFWPSTRPKNVIPRWYTGRKWHIPMASNRKRSRGRIKAYDMGQGPIEGPIVPLQWCTGRA